jgi:hypothetical protein
MSTNDFSRDNSKKLDRLILAIEGTEDYPGINGRLSKLETILFGKDGGGGLIQQHMILWRVHVWILCTLSALIGTGLTVLVQRYLHHP